MAGIRAQLLIALPLCLYCAALSAAPAPWYQWRSKLTAKRVCTQTSPGEGWEKLRGAYQDARCTRSGIPGQVPGRRQALPAPQARSAGTDCTAAQSGCR